MRNPVLYALVFLGVYLSYLVLSPFFVALTFAALFATVFFGMRVALATRLGHTGAALATTLAVALLIIAPAAVLVSAVVGQAPQAIESMKAASQSAPRRFQDAWGRVRELSPIALPEDPTDLIATGTERATTYLTNHAGPFVAGVLSALGTLGTMLLALFFFLRDGAAIAGYVRDRLPFAPDESARLLNDTRDLVVASVGATLAVSAAQGTIGGIAFAVLGLGAAAFWGVATAFASLVPVVGASLIWVPAAAWLLVSGATGRGIAMLLIGVFGISMIDNILRPLILSGRTSISGLVIFFGLLGGAAAFGFVGLLVGPIVLVLTARLLEELRRIDPSAQS